MTSLSATKLRIWELPETELDAVSFLQERSILPRQRKCIHFHDMKLYIFKRSMWKCNQCNLQVGLRKDNWFELTRIPFSSALRFIYCWCEDLTTHKFYKSQLDVGKNTVIEWKNYMRELCVLEMENKSNAKIGGPGCIVEVDESIFTKRENNCFRESSKQWVFGGICKETNESFLVTVPDQNESTIVGKIIENIADGSTICSDSWRSYQTDGTETKGFLQAEINHEYNFIDSDTGVQSQAAERMWGSGEWRKKRYRGKAKHYLECYLPEFIWRQYHLKEKIDCFESLLSTISTHFPPKSDGSFDYV